MARSRPNPRNGQRLAIESVSDHRHPMFAGALALYNRVFPEKERIDRRYFVRILEEKRLGLLHPFNLHFLVARRGKQVVGLATGSYLAVVNMGFVGYLAVEPGLKGARIGSRLRERLVAEFRRDARAAGRQVLSGVLGEVEADNPWLRHLVRARGALALDFDYRQPSLGEEGAVPLVLYLEPVGEPLRRLSVTRLRALLYAIYRRMYRIGFPLKNGVFRQMLKGLRGRRFVAARR